MVKIAAIARFSLAALLAALLAACSTSSGGGSGGTGDVRFLYARLPEALESGHRANASLSVISAADKQNVYLRLDLYRLAEGETTSSLNIDQPVSQTHWHLWAKHIENLPANNPEEINAGFDLPPGVEAGRYAAVFSINAVDWFPGDDALQGEESADLANNVVVLESEITVAKPDRPDLQIVSFKPTSFLVKAPDSSAGPLDASFMAVATEIICKGMDLTGPFRVRFELGLPGEGGALAYHPLNVSLAGVADEAHPPAESYEFPVVAHHLANPGNAPASGDWVDASLVANKAAGRTFHLYLTDEALAALPPEGGGEIGQLRMRVDPEDAFEEWRDGEFDDNTVQTPVYVLGPPEEEQSREALYANSADEPAPQVLPAAALACPSAPIPGIGLDRQLVDEGWAHNYGNDKVSAYFRVDGAISEGALTGGAIPSGALITLTDWQGMPAGVTLGGELGATGKATQLKIILNSTTARLYNGSQIVNYCTDANPFRARNYYFNPLVALDMPNTDYSSCSDLKFTDLNGGQLLSGDKIKFSGNLYGTDYYVVANGSELGVSVGATSDAAAIFTIKRTDGAANRDLRFTTDNSVLFDLFSKGFIPLRVKASANVNDVSACDNVYSYYVEAFEVAIQNGSGRWPLINGTTVLDARDYSVSRSAQKSKTFYPGGIPIEVTLKGTGTLGIRNAVTAGPYKKLAVTTGPYFDMVATATAEVDAVVADAGVGIDLTLLSIDMPYRNTLTVSSTAKSYDFTGDWILHSLDGDLFVFADTAAGCGTLALHACHWKDYLLSWPGIVQNESMFDPIHRDL